MMFENGVFRIRYENGLDTQDNYDFVERMGLRLSNYIKNGYFDFNLHVQFKNQVSQVYRITGTEAGVQFKAEAYAVLTRSPDVLEPILGIFKSEQGYGIEFKFDQVSDVVAIDLSGVATGSDTLDRFTLEPLEFFGEVTPIRDIAYVIHSLNVHEYADVTLNVDMDMGPLPNYTPTE